MSAHAQSVLKGKAEVSPVTLDSAYFIGEWVIDSSIRVQIDGVNLSRDHWFYDRSAGSWKLSGYPDSLSMPFTRATISFEYLPYSFSRQIYLRPYMEIDPNLFEDPDSLQKSLKSRRQNRKFQESDLIQSGSLSRGIIVGSNQDFALESGLNFELRGKLTENITINASLTDQSIPIQPDGTTQNLREFDKVFIEVDAPSGNLQMGDVDISMEQSSFARLNRRLQGAKGSSVTSYGNYGGAASVVRGTYRSVSFDGQDGVQGPYRLRGRNDEEFIIILAGTEKVYVNGQPVERGAQNDYVIDYGLGEVYFTNNLLVKDETRIVIEYEYVDQDFNRTLVAAEGSGKLFGDALTIGATVIRQSDGDELLSQQTLSRDDIDLLSSVGDELHKAVVSGARVATEQESNQYVLYAKTDTLYNGESYTIYQLRPGSEQAIYRVRFTKVGKGEGSYERISSEVNGLQYQWVGPGLGSYSPFRQLPAPEEHQMVAFNGNYRLSDEVQLFGEWSASAFDANRFSSQGDGDNTDMAYEGGIRVQDLDVRWGTLSAEIERRFTGKRFKAFERIREVEFDRKWNISRADTTQEVLNNARLQWSWSENSALGAEFGTVEREGFEGMRQAATINSRGQGIIQLNYDQDWVKTNDRYLSREGNWFRQKGNIRKAWDLGSVTFAPYLSFEQEDRREERIRPDSLDPRSNKFYDLGPGLQIKYRHLELDVSIARRTEEGVLNNTFRKESVSMEHRYQVQYRPSASFSTAHELRIRDKEYTNAFESEGRTSRRGLMIRSATQYAVMGRFLEGDLYYQANTQRQALLQESYIEVGPEIGQYTWEDLNMDGTQQVDEFFPEVSANEGTFIRQYLPSDELLPSIDLNTRVIHTLKPFLIFEKDAWWSEISLRSRLDLMENSTTDQLKDIYLLNLSTFRNDSTTIQGRLLLEKEADLLAGIQNADLALGYTRNQSLNRRSTESIKNRMELWYVRSAIDLTQRTRISLNGQYGVDESRSSRISNRNYEIQTLSVVPGFNTTINRSWNAGLDLSFIRKTDRFPVIPVEAKLFKVTSYHRMYLWKKLQANLRLEVRNTRVDGSSSAYGNYELTEGTGEGTNLIWSLNTSYRANNLIRFSFNYDGRTALEHPNVHTLKLVVSATF